MLKLLKSKLENLWRITQKASSFASQFLLQVSEEEASKICQGRHEDQLLKSYLLSEIRTSTPESQKARWRVKDTGDVEWRRLPATFCCFRFCFLKTTFEWQGFLFAIQLTSWAKTPMAVNQRFRLRQCLSWVSFPAFQLVPPVWPSQIGKRSAVDDGLRTPKNIFLDGCYKMHAVKCY